MRKVTWAILAVLPLLATGLLYAKSLIQSTDKTQQVSEAGYICPITGEQLPCPNCCPLNNK
jgi:hypothetical protein